jgi:hypothetical protein
MSFLLAALMTSAGMIVVIQELTLAERVAATQQDIMITVNADGPLPSVDEGLRDTDIIVRGVVGASEAHLSKDGRSIYTTHSLINARVAYSNRAQPVLPPGVTPKPFALTLPGGVVRIGNFSATIHFDVVPELKPGMEIIAFLKERDGAYGMASRSVILQVRQSVIEVLSPRAGEYAELVGAAPEAALSTLVNRKTALAGR